MHGNLTRHEKVSLTLTGKPKVCSICGEEGHNRRSCPQNEEVKQLHSGRCCALHSFSSILGHCRSPAVTGTCRSIAQRPSPGRSCSCCPSWKIQVTELCFKTLQAISRRDWIQQPLCKPYRPSFDAVLDLPFMP